MKIPFRHSLAVALGVAALAMSVSPTRATTYPGNGNSSFGGPLGLGSLTFTDNGTTVFGTFTRGPGFHNDTLVIYIDSIAGGLGNTSGMDDAGDDLRRALSGWNGTQRSTVNFASGFNADFGLAIHNNSFTFGGLWQTLAGTGNNGLPFVDSVNLSGGGNGAATYTFDFNWSEIGLGSPSSFRFVASYVANSAYRSNEAIGASDAGAGDVAFGTLTFSGSELYTVPEPSGMALAGLGLLAVVALRRFGR